MSALTKNTFTSGATFVCNQFDKLEQTHPKIGKIVKWGFGLAAMGAAAGALMGATQGVFEAATHAENIYEVTEILLSSITDTTIETTAVGAIAGTMIGFAKSKERG